MSTDKRSALKEILTKLEKLLPHLADTNPHEAAAALGKINKLLKSAKLDWHDLVSLLVEQGPSLNEFLQALLFGETRLLIEIGRTATLFHSTTASWADVMIGDHRQTLPLEGPEFCEWLVHQFYLKMKEAPKPASLKSAIRTLAASARYEGSQHEVFLRTAKRDGRVFVDIGDHAWHVVEIDGTGWRMIEDSPVRFRRAPGMAALPIPERGGSIEQLRPLVNLTDSDFVLYVSWILDALCPGRPHPVLYLAGEPGAAKTTAGKIARSLTDPNDVPLRNLPASVRDLFIDAHAAHMLAYDNLSSISPSISDGLCQIATGGGFGTRKLYTDTTQILIGGYRPVILAGLQNAIDRGDLGDRAVVLSMPYVVASQRRSETELWKRFEACRPQIFGALLDCVVRGLQRLPQVRLARPPRMIDFAMWAIAASPFADGSFVRALEGAATEAIEAVAEVDPVVIAVAAFMAGRESPWSGTAAGLLHELSHDHTEAAPSRSRAWSKEPAMFSKKLRLAAATLRKLQVEVTFGRAPDRRRTRAVTLRKIASERLSIVPADSADGCGQVDGMSESENSNSTVAGRALVKPR